MALCEETPLSALKDLLEEWEKATVKGTAKLTLIANANQKRTHADGESWNVLTDANALHTALKHKLEREAHHAWKQLNEVIDRLSEIVSKMRSYCFDEVKKIPFEYNGMLFHSNSQYELRFQRLVMMYQQELMSKSLILYDILDANDHDTAVVYIASWQMQPFIEKTYQNELLQLVSPPVKRESTNKLVK